MKLQQVKNILVIGLVASFDVLATLLLFLFALILYPTTYFRGIERCAAYLRLLLPRGLVLPSVRAYLDINFGYYNRVVSETEALLTTYESIPCLDQKDRKLLDAMLTDLYSLIAQAHLKSGNLEMAATTMIRAYNKLGVQKLRGLGELDIKTAHIVRAGLSAGRLLDDGGVATLLIKPNPGKGQTSSNKKGLGFRTRRQPSRIKSGKSPEAEDGVAKDTKPDKFEPPMTPNKVLQFPQGQGKSDTNQYEN